MSIHNRRRVGRRLERAQLVLRAMEAGCALHVELTKTGPSWVLSDGTPVTDFTARLVIASASVAGADDALFDDAPPQTFRWWKPTT
jgi:hypothetical protein